MWFWSALSLDIFCHNPLCLFIHLFCSCHCLTVYNIYSPSEIMNMTLITFLSMVWMPPFLGLIFKIFRSTHHNFIFWGEDDNKMQCLASNINMKLRHRTRTLVPLFSQHECAAWVGQQEDWTGLPGFATNFLPHYYCYKILKISASLLFPQGRGPTIPT